MWFKFPLLFERNETSGLTIYKRVLRFLFPTAYIKRPATDYAAYEALMLQKRPFKLFLKHDRKVDRHYSRLEYRFGAELEITDDTTLEQLWERVEDSKECELDVRFSEAGLALFEMKNLKDYEDESKRRGHYEDSGPAAVELRDCFNNLSE